MKSFKSHYFLLFLLMSAVINPSFAQEEVKKEKIYKNTVRYNISNPLLFGFKSLIFGYERTVGEHQSFSINLGQTSLPKILPDTINANDTMLLANNSTQKGFNASFDYRFYLSKENKYNAPRGVYVAPYISYNFFERKNTWNLNTNSFQGDVTTTFNLTMFTTGGELGYQFVLWKRFAIDLILIGPGLTSYSLKASLSTTLSPDDEAALLKKINDRLADRIPGYSLVIDDNEFETTGNTKTTSIGFRYMIHLGFRF